MKCPNCQSEHYYEGFSAKECGNPECLFFIKGSKSANEFVKQNSPTEISSCNQNILPGTGEVIDLPDGRVLYIKEATTTIYPLEDSFWIDYRANIKRKDGSTVYSNDSCGDISEINKMIAVPGSTLKIAGYTLYLQSWTVDVAVNAPIEIDFRAKVFEDEQ